MGEPVIKSLGDAALENILDKDPGKDKVHKKPETSTVMVDIIDPVMLNMYEKPEPRDGMLKTNPKGKYVNVNEREQRGEETIVREAREEGRYGRHH
jgi:hypothetical protein